MVPNVPMDTPAAPIPHTAREFNSFPGANYVLPADGQEAARLKLQHEVLKAAFEGRILLPPFKSDAACFILDSGTGSASWLLDVATQVPSSSILHGIDIEDCLFPKMRPPNVSFSVDSVSALPMGWTNKFDYVHQRLLIAALRRAEWPKALQEISRVLRPGGWIQLGEASGCRAGPNTERHRSMVRALFNARDLLLDVNSEIPFLLREAKFTNIQVEKRRIPVGAWAGQPGKNARDNFIGVYRGMKTPILRLGGLDFVKTEEEFDQLLDSVEREWDETEGAVVEFQIFYAQSSL